MLSKAWVELLELSTENEGVSRIYRRDLFPKVCAEVFYRLGRGTGLALLGKDGNCAAEIAAFNLAVAGVSAQVCHRTEADKVAVGRADVDVLQPAAGREPRGRVAHEQGRSSSSALPAWLPVQRALQGETNVA